MVQRGDVRIVRVLARKQGSADVWGERQRGCQRESPPHGGHRRGGSQSFRGLGWGQQKRRVGAINSEGWALQPWTKHGSKVVLVGERGWLRAGRRGGWLFGRRDKRLDQSRMCLERALWVQGVGRGDAPIRWVCLLEREDGEALGLGGQPPQIRLRSGDLRRYRAQVERKEADGRRVAILASSHRGQSPLSRENPLV